MTVKFSIVIPAYNKEKYIRQCIDSIYAQTYRDFEIIVVDDGSTDSTGEILEEYKSKDNFKLIRQKNCGVSKARNVGLEHCTGDFVTFIDADDFIATNFLENIAAEIARSHCDLLLAGFTKFFPDNTCKEVTSTLPKGIVTRNDFFNNFVSQHTTIIGIFGWVFSKFVRREIIRDNHIEFDPNLRLSEDLDFWMRVYDYANRIYISGECGYWYRQESITFLQIRGAQIANAAMWHKIYNKFARNNPKDRQTVIENEWDVAVWHLLEFDYPGMDALKREISRLESIIPNAFTSEIAPDTFLKRTVIKKRYTTAWLYLNLRSWYKRLKKK